MGILLAYGGIRVHVALGPSDIPRLDEVGVDVQVVAFAAGLSLAAGILAGLAPVLHTHSRQPVEGLRHGSERGSAAVGRRFRHALVVSELTLTLMLLVGAGLLGRSFAELTTVDPGFESERLLTLQLEPPMGTKYPELWQRTAFFREPLERVEQHPEVHSATMVSAPPLGEGDFTAMFSVIGQVDSDRAGQPLFIVECREHDRWRQFTTRLKVAKHAEPGSASAVGCRAIRVGPCPRNDANGILAIGRFRHDFDVWHQAQETADPLAHQRRIFHEAYPNHGTRAWRLREAVGCWQRGNPREPLRCYDG